MDSKAYIRYRCELNGKEYTPVKFNKERIKCDKAFQKIIKNSKNEKKYCINYYLYEPNRSTPEKLYYALVAEANLYRNDQEDWFFVRYQGTNEGTIADIEAFFEDMYEKMGCNVVPY